MARRTRKEVEVEDGPTVARSPSEFVKGSAIVGAMLLLSLGICGLGPLSFYGAIVTDDTMQKIYLWPLGLLLLGVGGALVYVLGVGLARQCYYLLNKERFVIGTTALQWVLGEDEVRVQLPYDNIRSIKLKTLRAPNGSEYHIIGIKLRDPERADTFIRDNYRRKEAESHGFDFAVWEGYELPIHDFYSKLRKAWVRAGDEEAE